MRRRGWSNTKTARAIDEQRKADAKSSGAGDDSLELWNAVLRGLSDELKLPYLGLFVRFYSGAIATEEFTASRREIPRADSRQEALGSLEHDKVTIFPSRQSSLPTQADIHRNLDQ
jgi:hypothetical protein